MVGLPREVGRGMVIDALLFESLVAQVTPQDRRHAQFMRLVEGAGDLDQLPAALLRTEIDRGPDGRGAHVPRIAHRAEQDLVVGVGIGKQLVVVELDDERYPVRIFPGHGPEHAEGRSHGIAAALEGQLHDVLRIEIGGIRGERGPRGVLDALIHGQDRDIARAAQAAVRENPPEAAQRADVAVGIRPDALHGVGSRQVQRLLVDRAAYVGEVITSLLPENFNSLAHIITFLGLIFHCNSDSKSAARSTPPGRYFRIFRYSVGDSPVCFLKKRPRYDWSGNRSR